MEIVNCRNDKEVGWNCEMRVSFSSQKCKHFGKKETSLLRFCASTISIYYFLLSFSQVITSFGLHSLLKEFFTHFLAQFFMAFVWFVLYVCKWFLFLRIPFSLKSLWPLERCVGKKSKLFHFIEVKYQWSKWKSEN